MLLTTGHILNKKLYTSGKAGILLLASVIFLISTPSAFAQNSFGVLFNFVKPNTQQSLEEVASNVLKLKNTTRQKQEVVINISIPDGWQLFSKAGQTIALNPYDSVFVPVRIIPSKKSLGSVNYVINAFLTSSTGFQLANDYWYIDIKKISNWMVQIPRQKIYFVSDSNTTQFDLIMQNLGNSDEVLTVDLMPQKNLQVIDSMGKQMPYSLTIPIRAGSDSVITCRVRKTAETKPIAKIEGGEDDAKEKYSLKISVRNEKGTAQDSRKLWRGNIDFFELSNELTITGHGYSSLPVTVELNSYDVLDNTTLSLDIYGSAFFNKDRSLTYRYQTNYVSNFVEPNAYIGTYHYLGYFSRMGAIEIGNLSSGKQGAFIGGKGAKASLFTKRNQLSGMFVLNPEIFRGHFQKGLAVNNVFRTSKFSSDTYFQQKWDDQSKINSTYAGTATTFQITRKHIVRVALGGTHDKHYLNPASRLSLFGFGYELGYTGSVKKISFGISHRYGSKKYSVNSGVLAFSPTLTYNFTGKYSLSFIFDYYNREAEMYAGGVQLPPPPRTERQRYELRLAANTRTAKIILRPFYMYQDIYLLRTATKAVGLDYRPTTENALKFYSTIEAGFVKAYDTGLSDFFYLQFFANLKYRQLSYSFRYFYGPYQTIEQIRFIQTGENPQKLVMSGYYDYWIIKSKLQFKTNATFNYDTYFKRLGFILRPEMFYYTKSGFAFSLYGEYLLNSQAARANAAGADISDERSTTHDFNFGAGIKKTFNIPLNRRKFHDVEITVFKDQNGNGAIDAGEETAENVLINVKSDIQAAPDTTGTEESSKAVNYELLSSRAGKVKFENLPTGNYNINLMPLVEMGGWFHEKQITCIIDGKKKIDIPLIKAARVAGNIALEMDKYSRYEGTIDLSRIRITATGAGGNTYSVLTGKDGQFSMFLPIGEYSVEVNQSALGGAFEFVKNSVKINLNNPNASYNVTFYVREKKRTMNIKEFKE